MATILSDPPTPELDSDALYEIIDGDVVELEPMGAYENLLASVLLIRLGAFSEDQRIGRAVQETLFDLKPLNRKRRPDVAFVSRERWPLDRRVPRTPAWDVVPDLAVEVVSPTNTFNEIVGKVGEYFTAGVRVVWLVIPEFRQVYVYESADRVRVLHHDGELTGDDVLPGFRLKLADFFEEPPAEGE